MSGSLTVSIAQFRTDRPEFSDSVQFSDPLILRYLNMAQNQLDPCRWADLLVEGIELWVCHFLTLQKRNSQPNAQGTAGLALSKTVGRASIDYDTSSVTNKNGGPWNLTSYGTQLLWWANLIGGGGLQITGSFTPQESILGTGVLNQDSNTW